MGFDLVGGSEVELEGVALGGWNGGGRVVEVAVDGSDGEAEALVERDAQGIAFGGGVGVEVVPAGDVGDLLVEAYAARQFEGVDAGEGGADEVLVGSPGGVNECLVFVLQESDFEIEKLFRALDDGVSDAAAVDLLEVESLAVIVVEGGLGESVEAGREVLVTFGIGVIDGAFGRG